MQATRHLRVWHRWLGLFVLGVLVLTSATGTLLAYKKELVRVFVTPGAVLPPQLVAADLAPQLDRIAGRFAPPDRARIKAPNAEEPYWTLTGADGQIRLLAVGSLEPYTGRLWIVDTLEWVRGLHTELLSGALGHTVLLVSGLGGLVLTVTGLLLWWPSRARCRWFWVRPRSLRSPLLLQHHRHFGAVAVPLLLVSLLTGSLMVWQKTVGPLLPADPPSTGEFGLDRAAPASRLLSGALDRVPGGWPTYIRLGVPGDPEVSFRFRLADEWHPNGRSSVAITERALVQVSRSDQAPPVRRLLNQLYPLHSGYGLSGIYSLLIVCSGLSLCWLGVSGFASWVRRSR